MPSYNQLILHIVFATKNRTSYFGEKERPEVWKYLAGAVQREGGSVVIVNGMADHVHLLVHWRPDVTVSDLVRSIKANSSAWVKETWPEISDFAWQDGYGVFSVSKSQEDIVRAYIENQAEHHKKRDSKAELRALLEKHGMEFDEAYFQ